jgi:DNA-binding CsgD family transcriptional regulator
MNSTVYNSTTLNSIVAPRAHLMTELCHDRRLLPEAASGTAPPRTLHGRAPELARIDDLLVRPRGAQSGALVLRGEAGAGKSALLDEAARRAAGLRVLRASGVESEAELPFAALHQLVRQILPRLAALPAIQQRALRGALGLGAHEGEHRFLVSVATLSLLAEAAEDRPLLCLVDDAQWLDEASAETLAFVARRLHAEGIAMIFAAREGDVRAFEAPGLPELPLGGLAHDAAAALLEERPGRVVSAEVRERLVEATAGNPLALLELSAALSDAQRAGDEPILDPLPVSARIERAFLARVRDLPDATRALLVVAAADEAGELATVLDAAARLRIAPDALDAAERAELVRVHGGRVELRHPLLRSAVYQGAPASRRRAAHAVLAEALTEPSQADRRAWHRAAASVDPDPAVVDELERAAQRARRRGGFAAASLALERAAALTVEDDHRARQLAAAGEGAWLAGRGERATLLLERARPLASEPRLRADIDRTRGLIGLNGGVPADACRLLLGAATEVAAVDGRRALYLLNLASLAATYACDTAAIVAIGEVAAGIEGDGSAAARLLADHLEGLGAYYAGDFARATPRLRAALALADAADAEASADFGEVLIIAASVGLILGDDRAVHELHRRMVARARSGGALGLLPLALPRLAVSDIWAGQWLSAEAGLREALELARGIGHHVAVAYLLSELAIVAALRGDEDACRALAAESLELAGARRLAYVGYIANSALVALDLGLGHADAALERARAVPAMPGLDFWDALDRIEAAVRAGEPGAARGWLEPFASWAQSTGSGWARAVALHGRALLAGRADEAERLFAAALAMHAGAGRPFERARTELAFGALLRRARRRKEARRHLRAALETFASLGAGVWAERARAELRASGQTARRRDPGTIDDLTAQERQIAQRVAEGGTNRDIAAQLFLSPRTIDFHLRNIFRKLGISSRIELARLDLNAAR